MKKIPMADRLIARLAPPNERGCRLWTGSGGRYGSIKDEDGRTQQTHRVAWELANGAIPEGMDVLHRCDQPRCCEPAHLFLGTDQDNADDRNTKERQARAEHHGRAKLTRANIELARRRVAEGATQALVAAAFGVSQSTLSRALSGRTWS